MTRRDLLAATTGAFSPARALPAATTPARPIHPAISDSVASMAVGVLLAGVNPVKTDSVVNTSIEKALYRYAA